MKQGPTKDSNTGNLPTANPMNKTTRSNVTYNEDVISQYTRPDSIGGSIYGDIMDINAKKLGVKPPEKGKFEEFQGKRKPLVRVPTIVSDFGEADNPVIMPTIIPEDVAERMDPEPGDEILLPPFKVTDAMNFPEFCRRWRAAHKDDFERQKLLSYV